MKGQLGEYLMKNLCHTEILDDHRLQSFQIVRRDKIDQFLRDLAIFAKDINRQIELLLHHMRYINGF